MEERIVKRLMTSVKCSHCGQNYLAENIKILGHNQGLWFIKAYCTPCHSHYLIAVSVESETQKAFIVSDLSPEEMARFCSARMLVADDVLDMHAFLKTFDGDFTGLFGRERVS